MSRAFKAGLIAVFSISALVATDYLPRGNTGETETAAFETPRQIGRMPALLQAMPADEALDCTVETERTFVASRKAFVMKKAVVCR